MATKRARPLAVHRRELGEGPIWDHHRSRIVWVDITAGLVLETDLDGRDLAQHQFPTSVGFVTLRRGGGLLAATRDGFTLLDADGEVERVHEVDADPSRRFNDGACTPVGTVLGGTMANDVEIDAGIVWSFDGRDARPVLDGVTLPNGMAWSLDGTTLYFIDSGWGTIDAFDYEPDPDRLTGRRTIAHVPEHAGTPDGMVIDAEGCLWLALYAGGQVLRLSPEGDVIDRILVPAPNVTSMAFVGPDLDRLAITTATQELDDDDLADWPRAGSLFLADPGVRGVLPHAFDG